MKAVAPYKVTKTKFLAKRELAQWVYVAHSGFGWSVWMGGLLVAHCPTMREAYEIVWRVRGALTNQPKGAHGDLGSIRKRKS